MKAVRFKILSSLSFASLLPSRSWPFVTAQNNPRPTCFIEIFLLRVILFQIPLTLFAMGYMSPKDLEVFNKR